MKLVDLVRTDILEYLGRKDGELLFNERDLQMHLAQHLISTKHYHDVDLEYYVPPIVLGDDYPWMNGNKRQEMRMDIVVSDRSEFLPVELKYKTRSHSKRLLRFGEQLSNAVEVLKDQGAEDLGMYDFWKDLRRVELVRNRFAAVKNGLAVFVTNDKQYLNPGRSTSNNYMLNMSDGVHGRQKHWLKPESTCARTHPDFDLDSEYTIQWKHNDFEGVEFHYCIVEI